jgi:beta-lactamase regulating signal transducer with metallopeptidase domain
MMHSLFDVALLDSMLVQAALRTLALAVVVGAALHLFKVRNPHHQLAAWSAVLAGALAMPLLMMWLVVEVPVQEMQVPDGKIAEPLVTATTMPAFGPDVANVASNMTPDTENAAPAAEAFDWAGLVTALYAGVAALLLLRLGVGLALTARIRAGARRIEAGWAGETDIRVTEAINAPVTIGSTILLPADFESWPEEKRDAVLLHERAHVTRGDFYVQGLAAVHRALFWFSPMAWWLHDRLAELAEDASDAEAASQVPYRADYAAVLLDFAQMPVPPRFKLAPLGVAMARPATVSRRIERVLADKGLPAFVSRGARAGTAFVVFTLACAAAVTICKVPAQAAVGIDVKPLQAAAPLHAAAGEVCSEGEAAARPISPLLPVMPVRPVSMAASAPVPVAPVRPVSPIAPIVPVTPIAAIPPVEFDTHADGVMGPPIHAEGLSVRVDHPAGWNGPDVDVDVDMEQIRQSLAAAGVKGRDFEKQLSARIEAAVARAEAQAEAAAERVRVREALARERQYAAAEPSGPVVKETRNVEAFTGVSFGGAGKVFITVGPKASVVLEADAVTLGRTRTEVENGVLKIRARNDDGFNGRGDITAYITVPELRQARVSGSGDLKVTGLTGGETELSVSGSGNVEATGKLKALDLDISGSGNAKMDALVVDEASVAISGSGSAVVDVREDLNVRVSGSGSVRYLTQPKDVSTSISGSGSVRRRDAT